MPIASPHALDRTCITKVIGNKLVPASTNVLAKRNQRLQTLASINHRLISKTGPILLPLPTHELRDSIAVFSAVVKDANTRLAVSTRTASFLVETFEGFRDLPVYDEADVLLVDPHAEGGRGDDDIVAFLVHDPPVEVVVFLLDGEACVVRLRAYAVRL